MICHICKETIKPGDYIAYENGNSGFAICGGCEADIVLSETNEMVEDGSQPLEKDEHYARLNVYPNIPVIGDKWEIDEETYWYFLEVLPPYGYKSTDNGEEFYMTEFYTRSITNKYSREGDRYFCEWAELDFDAVQEWY